MLRFIRQHPVVGLMLALGLEAWIALPGEAAIAVAAAAMAQRAWGLARIAAGGMLGLVGMVCNDLVLFSLSRAGRQLALHLWSHAGSHFRLSGALVVAAKFVPPLRSAAYVLYGIQGASLRQFLLVSLTSSCLWLLFYAALGRRFRHGIAGLLRHTEKRPGWWLAAETVCTLGGLLLLLRPLAG